MKKIIIKGIKILIGCVFIGSGFLFAGRLGSSIVFCIHIIQSDIIYAGCWEIENLTSVLMRLLIILFLLIISFSSLMCGFLFFRKTFRVNLVSFSLSVACLTLGVIMGSYVYFYAPHIPFFGHSHTIPKSVIKKELQDGLQEIRISIENYYQENGKYPVRIDNEIFRTYCYWFKWNNIPGKDNERLIKWLEEKLEIKIKNPKIERVDELTIRIIYKGLIKKNVIMFKLSKEHDYGGIIELNNKRMIPSEYIMTKDGWKPGLTYLQILYDGWKRERTFLSVPFIVPSDHPCSNKIIYVKTKPNQKIQPHQITDEGGWIYSPDSGDIRINCSHKDSKGVFYYEW